MSKQVNGIDELTNVTFSPAECPTIRLTQVFSLIKDMEDDLDIASRAPFNESFADGYAMALEKVKTWFLGDMKFNEETGEYENYLYGEKVDEN